MFRYLLISLIILPVFVTAQIPVDGSPNSVMPMDYHRKFRKTFIMPVVADTTAAHSIFGGDSLGRMILVRANPALIYFRDTTAGGHKWTLGFNPGSGALATATGDATGTVSGTNLPLTLATVNGNVFASNTLVKITVNAKGLITAAVAATSADLNSLYGFTPAPNGRILTINGVGQDLSADRTWTINDGNLPMTDITTNNSSTGQHGFLKKLPNDNTKFMDGTGNWATPPTASTTLAALTDVSLSGLANGQLLQYNSGTAKWNNGGSAVAGNGLAGRLSYWGTGNALYYVPIKWDSTSGLFDGFTPGFEFAYPIQIKTSGAGEFGAIEHAVTTPGSGFLATGTVTGQYNPWNIQVSASTGLGGGVFNLSNAAAAGVHVGYSVQQFQEMYHNFAQAQGGGANRGSGFYHGETFQGGKSFYFIDWDTVNSGSNDYSSRIHLSALDSTGKLQLPAGYSSTSLTADTTNYKVAVFDATGNLKKAFWNGLGGSGGGTPLPFADNQNLFKNNADNTKLLKFDLSPIATGQVRTASWPNASITVAGLNLAQAWTAKQTFNLAPQLTTSSTTNYIWTATDNAGNGSWQANAAGAGFQQNLQFQYNGANTGTNGGIATVNFQHWAKASAIGNVLSVNVDTNYIVYKYPLLVSNTHDTVSCDHCSVTTGSGDLAAKTSSQATVATYTPTGGDSTFNIGVYVTVTAVAGGETVNVTVSFKDQNNVSRTLNLFPIGNNSSNIGANGFFSLESCNIRCKAGNAITVATVIAGAGSITYDVGATITAIR